LQNLRLNFRGQDKDLPGRPDIVMPQLDAIIRVHGCFWHGHECPRGYLPATNRALWAAKIRRNRRRDRASARNLRALGWRVFTFWECRLRQLGAEPLLLRLQRNVLRASRRTAGEHRTRRSQSLAQGEEGPRSQS